MKVEKMTAEKREKINAIALKVTGGDEWMVEGLEEEQIEAICTNCPFCNRCYETGLCYGCAVWEEAMGNDL